MRARVGVTVACVLVATFATGCGDDPATPVPAGFSSIRQTGVTDGIVPRDAPAARSVDERVGVLVTSTTRLQAVSTAHGRTIDADTAKAVGINGGKALQAPKGHEVVLANLQVKVIAPGPDSQGVAAERISVPRGDRDDEVDTSGLTTADGQYLTIAAVFADDEQARIEVTDHGRTAALDLRTGRPSGDAETASMASYSGRTVENPLTIDDGDVTAPLAGGRAISLNWNVSSASRTPWSPGARWAPRDAAWLRLDLHPSETLRGEYDPAVGSGRLDARRSFSLLLPSGKVVRARADSVTFDSMGDVGSSVVLFAVPADFTEGQVRFQPQGSLVSADGRDRQAVTGKQVASAPVSLEESTLS